MPDELRIPSHPQLLILPGIWNLLGTESRDIKPRCDSHAFKTVFTECIEKTLAGAMLAFTPARRCRDLVALVELRPRR
jgi:hypothetical protein